MWLKHVKFVISACIVLVTISSANSDQLFDENYKEASSGNPSAQHNLGVMYSEGKHIHQDYKEAIKWYTKAAELGNTDSATNLGAMYSDGIGLPDDKNKAIYWYTKASNQGNASAQYNLGVMFYMGKRVTQDYKKAADLFSQAAGSGHVRSQYNMGIIYLNGQGVEKDFKKAADWFMKAAEQGHVDSQFNLGKMYSSGQGVSKDYQKAYDWYSMAADAGLKKAIQPRDELKQKTGFNTNAGIYKRMKLSHGVSVEIPAHWEIVSKENRDNVHASARAVVENSGVGGEERNDKNILTVRAVPVPTGAMIKIDVVVPPEFSEKDLESFTENDLKLLSQHMPETFKKVSHSGGPKFISMSNVTVVDFNGYKAMYYSYRRTSPVDGGAWTVHQYNIAMSGKVVELTLSHRESDQLLWMPILEKVKNSIELKN